MQGLEPVVGRLDALLKQQRQSVCVLEATTGGLVNAALVGLEIRSWQTPAHSVEAGVLPWFLQVLLRRRYPLRSPSNEEFYPSQCATQERGDGDPHKLQGF